MKVDYIDHMGDDLSVVNAARVSFDKESELDYNEPKNVGYLKEADRKLISYLATHGHWSPFAHTSVCFRFKAPIFVARQLVKHQVGLTWNEVSRRYVKSEPELWWPEKWRKAAENVKQGSSDEEFDTDSHTLYSATVEAGGTVVVDFHLCNEDLSQIKDRDAEVYLDVTAGTLSKYRVETQEGKGSVIFRALDLVSGDVAKIKCGFKFFTGTDDFFVQVI